MNKNERNKFIIAGAIIIVVLAVLVLLCVINVAQAIEITILFALVSATFIYAKRTLDIANATKTQAEEIREQRIEASRPIIIQKAVTRKVIPSELAEDYFEIYNAGNGTAIEVQVILLDDSKKPLDGIREGFLRAGESPMEFHPTFPQSTFYIVSEYQGISSHSPHPTWYQTWLPCELSVTNKVISGKLEFHEVSEDKRIGIFKSEFNNGSVPK